MSLSNPRTSASPVRRYFKVKGINGGGLTWWDKSAEQERTVDLPFSFVVLDTLSTISGFHKASNTGIFSNEVRDTRTGQLTVRNGGGVIAEGLYDQIKDNVKGKGGKFASSVYVAFKDGDELAIGNILLAGAALSEFFDFKKNRNLDSDPGVSITGFDGPHKSGQNEYWKPVFGSWTPNDLGSALALDKELQEYLDGKLSGKPEESPQEAKAEDPWGGASQQAFGGSTTFVPEPPF